MNLPFPDIPSLLDVSFTNFQNVIQEVSSQTWETFQLNKQKGKRESRCFSSRSTKWEKTQAAEPGEIHDINCRQSAAVNHAEAPGSQDSALTSSE